jgi:UDP-4-amino-4,6-dideoxy-N-acetyl-beta-L-altrosamine N-acetyltransferase
MAVTLRKIKEDDLEKIMRWRMDPDITRYMNTDPVLTLEGQKKWLHKIETDDTVMYWMIQVEDIPVGIICLIEIDWEKKTSSWGYYIGEKSARSLKLAISLEMSLYDFVFDELGFDSLHNEVFALNKGVVKLHQACGSRIVETVLGEVQKNGQSYDIVHINIDRQDWQTIRSGKSYEHICYTPTMKVHHIGYAVKSIEASAFRYISLGYRRLSDICDDTGRGVRILFLRHIVTGETIELVAPMGEESPVSGQLQKMKGLASPYHICYEVPDLQEAIDWLKKEKYILVDAPAEAPAIGGRKVAFLLHRDVGMIELVEYDSEVHTKQYESGRVR